MRRLLLLIAAIFALGAEPALAQQPAKAKAGRDRVCADDAKKFCSEVRPGGGRMYQCLAKNDAQLAPACRERLAAGKARWDAFVSACKSDAGKYCKGIPAGGARVLSCLKGREADLAPDCKAQFGRASRDPVVTQ
jgi:hypothetical protein